MNNIVFSKASPAMPKFGKGTEFFKLILSQASKDMREPLIPMIIPALSARLTEVKFMYSDYKFYEMCCQMGHLISLSGIGKALIKQLRSNQIIDCSVIGCSFGRMSIFLEPKG